MYDLNETIELMTSANYKDRLFPAHAGVILKQSEMLALLKELREEKQ